ncbi:hypothetical protein Rs2_50854 [Raphanus sativus]|nr:hypothetical protein Rs2_50854 [Raphanus sativus]
MSTFLSGGVARVRIGVGVRATEPSFSQDKAFLSPVLGEGGDEASIGFFCLRSLCILGGSSGFVTYPEAVYRFRSWQCYIALAFAGFVAAFRFPFMAIGPYPLCLYCLGFEDFGLLSLVSLCGRRQCSRAGAIFKGLCSFPSFYSICAFIEGDGYKG